MSWYQRPALAAEPAADAITAAPGVSETGRARANLPVAPFSSSEKPLTWFPSMLTAVWRPLRDVTLTQAETEKLPEVSTTGPGTVTLPAAVPFSATLCGPTVPGAQDAPLPSVPSWPWPETSWAVVPVPSSNVQCAAWSSPAISLAVSAPDHIRTSLMLPLTKSTGLPLYLPRPIIVPPAACHGVVYPWAGWGWPFTKSWMVPAVASWTPTMWYQVPGDGARLAPETVVAALTESEASLVKAKVPVSARNCRKNPLISVPSMLTTVWKPLVALSFTHAETVKLCDVLTTGPATATLLVAVPLNATLCGPISPAAQPCVAPSVPARPLPDESAAVVALPSSNVQCAARVVAAVAAAGASSDTAPLVIKPRHEIMAMTLTLRLGRSRRGSGRPHGDIFIGSLLASPGDGRGRC